MKLFSRTLAFVSGLLSGFLTRSLPPIRERQLLSTLHTNEPPRKMKRKPRRINKAIRQYRERYTHLLTELVTERNQRNRRWQNANGAYLAHDSTKLEPKP